MRRGLRRLRHRTLARRGPPRCWGRHGIADALPGTGHTLCTWWRTRHAAECTAHTPCAGHACLTHTCSHAMQPCTRCSWLAGPVCAHQRACVSSDARNTHVPCQTLLPPHGANPLHPQVPPSSLRCSPQLPWLRAPRLGTGPCLGTRWPLNTPVLGTLCAPCATPNPRDTCVFPPRAPKVPKTPPQRPCCPCPPHHLPRRWHW